MKKLKITAFLSEWGISPIKTAGKKSWYKALNRAEDMASLCVFTKSFYDDWYDYGSGEGGSIIDLCQKQMGMSYIETMNYLRKYI